MKRYDIAWGCGGACLTSIEEDSEGGYVQFEEVESLTVEVKRLRAVISRFAFEADNYEPNSGDDNEEAFATQIFIGELREMRRLVRGV